MTGTPALLVVDDESVHRDFVAAVLRPRGWRVEFAVDGAAALQATADDDYDLVLMDIQMPGMDGLETSAAIRARGGADAVVPIVAFSAVDGAALEQKMQTAGMDAHLPKPASPSALIDLVERWRPSATPHPGERLGQIFGEGEMAQMYGRLRERLEEALNVSEDPQRATEIAHGLAGVAGTLGFPEVHRAWLAVSEGDSDALEPAREATRKALLTLHRGA